MKNIVIYLIIIGMTKKKSEIKNDEFCIIIELIGRIEKEYGIQYNYDEYMLQIYKF